MNFLKSLFIPLYMMPLLGVSAYAASMLVQGGAVLSWGGVLMTTAPMTLFFGYAMASRKVSRTSARLPIMMAMGILGCGVSGWEWIAGTGEPVAMMLAGGGLLGFLAYAYWYSELGRAGGVIALGKSLPEFSLRAIDGTWVSSSSMVGRPTIMIFFRGNWCPLCMAQIREIAARYQELGRLGVRVALVSPQPHDQTIALAKSYRVNFQFLTDVGNVAARKLGIAAPWGVPLGMQMLGYDSETVLPTVVITDSAGRVIWTHETDNYRIRPEPDTFLEVLRGTGIVAAA